MSPTLPDLITFPEPKKQKNTFPNPFNLGSPEWHTWEEKFDKYKKPYKVQLFPPAKDDGKTYCNTWSKAIACTADVAAVTATISGAGFPVGITITGIALANEFASALICGPSISTATTAAGGIPGPAWWTIAISSIDAALTIAGY